MSEEVYSHVISILVENKSGVIQRVTGLFTRRGFNIDSIAVGESEVEGLARMVFVVKGDKKVLEQADKQACGCGQGKGLGSGQQCEKRALSC